MSIANIPITGALVGPAGGVPFGAGAAVYGVSWNKSSDPTLTRTDDSVAFTAEAGVDAGGVTNDFDTSEIYGDITEVVDGDGNAFVRIPKFYIEKVDTTNFKSWRISKNGGGAGYLPWCFWDFTNNVALDYVDVGKYPGSVSGGKLQSQTGVYPTINTNIVDFRTAAQANGAGYQQLDIHVVDMLQTLFYVEFATLHSQSIMAGYTDGRYKLSDVLTADTSPAANTLVVANATGAFYEVGQAISVGTTRGGNERFYGRTITNIQADTPGAGSTTITFDGAAVELFTDDILYNMGYKNGDAITATSGSVASNSTGKHYCKYREIISPWGNIWQFVDGVNINDNQAWVEEDADNYASNLFASPYTQLSYINHNADGYGSAMGYDRNNPFAEFPVAGSGAPTTYYADFYYQTTGQQIAVLGGVWYFGVPAGLTCWSLYYASSYVQVYSGARLVRKGG
jgi:hypothetical protein